MSLIELPDWFCDEKALEVKLWQFVGEPKVAPRHNH